MWLSYTRISMFNRLLSLCLLHIRGVPLPEFIVPKYGLGESEPVCVTAQFVLVCATSEALVVERHFYFANFSRGKYLSQEGVKAT